MVWWVPHLPRIALGSKDLFPDTEATSKIEDLENMEEPRREGPCRKIRGTFLIVNVRKMISKSWVGWPLCVLKVCKKTPCTNRSTRQLMDVGSSCHEVEQSVVAQG